MPDSAEPYATSRGPVWPLRLNVSPGAMNASLTVCDVRAMFVPNAKLKPPVVNSSMTSSKVAPSAYSVM